MAKFIDQSNLGTPLYSDVYAFLTQQERAPGAAVRAFEMTIDRSPACFTAVNWASNRGLYRCATLTPGRRFLIEVTPEGEEFIKEWEEHLANFRK